MKTISSKNSLILWDKNENKSNISLSIFNGDTKFLKPFYFELFNTVALVLKEGVDVFVQMWSDKCDFECNEVRKALKKKLADYGCSWDEEAVEKVVVKFRGNAGEILVEALVENGITSLGNPSTYEPVDPTNERFIDATIEKDGLPIGIQIKNYKWKSNVKRDVLTKAESMIAHWILVEKKIPENRILEFLESPSQYVISTCPPVNDLLLDEVKNAVVFLGPDWLDSLKLQGDKKTGEKSRWKVFANIADEISKV